MFKNTFNFYFADGIHKSVVLEYDGDADEAARKAFIDLGYPEEDWSNNNFFYQRGPHNMKYCPSDNGWEHIYDQGPGITHYDSSEPLTLGKLKNILNKIEGSEDGVVIMSFNGCGNGNRGISDVYETTEENTDEIDDSWFDGLSDEEIDEYQKELYGVRIIHLCSNRLSF